MKRNTGILSLLSIIAMTFSAGAFAADACRSAALSAAENAYGNDPVKTRVTTITEGKEYHVAVGIGNEEDGEYDYDVVFPSGCDSTPSVATLGNS